MKKIYLSIFIISSFILLNPSTSFAIPGTCSSHGGVSCSVGSDWDGSAICNDGWKDSSELFSEQIMCKDNIKHFCTTEELYGIKSKHNISELQEQIFELNAQVSKKMTEASQYENKSGMTAQQIGDAEINKSLKMSEVGMLIAKIRGLQGDLSLKNDNVKKECESLGQESFNKKMTAFYSSIANQKKNDFKEEIDLCVSSGYKNMHQVNDKCVCNNGFIYNSQNKCEIISDFKDVKSEKNIFKKIQNKKDSENISPKEEQKSGNNLNEEPVKKIRWYQKIYKWFKKK